MSTIFFNITIIKAFSVSYMKSINSFLLKLIFICLNFKVIVIKLYLKLMHDYEMDFATCIVE
jgi:hypothetical protein